MDAKIIILGPSQTMIIKVLGTSQTMTSKAVSRAHSKNNTPLIENNCTPIQTIAPHLKQK